MIAARDGRTLLRAMGIGDYNATMCIQSLWLAPATTDPKSQPVMLMVGAIQDWVGAERTGYLDQPTASALRGLIGDGWMNLSWATVLEAVLAGGRRPAAISTGITKFVKDPQQARSLAGFGSVGPLPDVPGGILTYAVGAFLLWKFLSTKKTSRVDVDGDYASTRIYR